MPAYDVDLSFARAQSLIGGAAGGVPYQTATSATTFVTIGVNGYVLTSNGTSPQWSPVSGTTVGTSTQVQTVLRTTNATHYLTFVDSNNASASAESVYTTSSFVINPSTGNVGIGTSSPSGASGLTLAINGGTNQTRIALKNTTTGDAVGDGFQIVLDSGGLDVALEQRENASIRFITNNTEKLRITANGGISFGASGTAYGTAGQVLQSNGNAAPTWVPVSGTTVGTSTQVQTVLRTTNATHYLTFVDSNNSSATAESVYTTSSFVINPANGNVGIGTTSTTNKFEVAGTSGQLFSVSDSFTGTIFAASDISGIPSIEVLDTGLVKFAQYNGQVTIGTGTVASSSATLSVYGMLYTTGTLGEIRASSEITAYFSSDRRLKENIKLIEDPITMIDQISGVYFDWTDEHIARRGGEDGYFVRKHDIGVIAQEIEAVMPEVVAQRADGFLAVKYEKIVPLLIEAIKAQQVDINLLKSEIQELKNRAN